jgi:hypothetical protein
MVAYEIQLAVSRRPRAQRNKSGGKRALAARNTRADEPPNLPPLTTCCGSG